MYGHFAGQKKCDRNIEVPVLSRQGSPVIQMNQPKMIK